MLDSRTALLQALIRGESYGLELIERVGELYRGRKRLSQATIYPMLRALESEGLVRSFDGDPMPERGGRPRRYYELTAKGLRVARQEAADIAGFLRPALEDR